MPGLFGAFNCGEEYCDDLKARFSALFGSCESKRFGNGILGAHAFREARALLRAGRSCHFAVDGEGGIYRHARSSVEEKGVPLFEVQEGSLETTALCKGNIAVVDEQKELLFLAMDWSGIFPMYYTRLGDGILFSSHCKPLAAVVGASPDYVGVIEYMMSTYFLNDRTPFRNISRFLPGQVLAYSLKDGAMSLRETTRHWTGVVEASSPELDVARIWEVFREACSRCLDPNQVHGIMLSAGWDSRLLLAGLADMVPTNQVCSLSHGDPRSRELKLSRRVSGCLGIKHLENCPGDHLNNLEMMSALFQRCETVMDPLWHLSAQRLAGEGVTCITAGVMGEVFGGHLRRGEDRGPRQKIKYFASRVLLSRRSEESSKGDDLRETVRLIKRGFDRRPWYVKKDSWHSLRGITEAIEGDIESELQRYRERGIASADQLFEAYMAEHTAAQWWGRQMLTCRATVDVALPYADREFLTIASRTRISAKINNRLNRKVLKAFAPKLLRCPTAAILLPAYFPLIAQEATRLIRWGIERMWSHLYYKSRGKIGPPRMEWRSFPALRKGAPLLRLVDDMRLELLDKPAVRRCIADMAELRNRIDPAELGDQLLMIYTMELMLR